MRIRIIEHFDRETGAFLGYEIQYKPFSWWPMWRSFYRLMWLKNRQEVEHDVFFVLSVKGIIKTKRELN